MLVSCPYLPDSTGARVAPQEKYVSVRVKHGSKRARDVRVESMDEGGPVHGALQVRLDKDDNPIFPRQINAIAVLEVRRQPKRSCPSCPDRVFPSIVIGRWRCVVQLKCLEVGRAMQALGANSDL